MLANPPQVGASIQNSPAYGLDTFPRALFVEGFMADGTGYGVKTNNLYAKHASFFMSK
jgi:hypothetical protein